MLDLEHFLGPKSISVKLEKQYLSFFPGLLGPEWVVRSPFFVIMFLLGEM